MADELARQRRELPRVAIEKEHRVDADPGRGPTGADHAGAYHQDPHVNRLGS
jgi:hypothetical protein